MKLSEQLKNEAISLGLCLQWQSEWRDNTGREELIGKYITGIDFCIAHDWPKKEFVKRWFGDIMHQHGIYVDEEVNLNRVEGTIVLLGHCTGVLTCDGYAVTDIYILHDSDVRIESKEHAKTFVNKSEQSKVELWTENEAFLKSYIIKTGEANGK